MSQPVNTGVQNDARVRGPCQCSWTMSTAREHGNHFGHPRSRPVDASVHGPCLRPVNTGIILDTWVHDPWTQVGHASVHGPCLRPVNTGIILDTRVHGPWTQVGRVGVQGPCLRPMNAGIILDTCVHDPWAQVVCTKL